MNLDDIQGGSLCVIDSNILLYAEQGVSHQAQRLLRRCAGGELSGILPQTVWQEVTHKLMMAEAVMKRIITGSNPAARLAGKPEAVRSLSLYRAKVQALIDLGLGFEVCTLDDLTTTGFRLQEKYGLLTNDAVVLAVAIRLKADALVSGDKAFQPVTEVPIHSPTDMSLWAAE
ncbi:MAG TPA: type II toxin-antitoxin system VapC family toxin [Dissulfurispiraceae bacterium]|nr:type II toxin-antitoxin system VapC family toxin [Dissulfurispiraceae bacterium]